MWIVFGYNSMCENFRFVVSDEETGKKEVDRLNSKMCVAFLKYEESEI